MFFDQKVHAIVGDHGSLQVGDEDEVSRKLAMLIEGECEGLGPTKAAEKYGFSKQRYLQLRHAYEERQEGIGLHVVRQTRGQERRIRG